MCWDEHCVHSCEFQICSSHVFSMKQIVLKCLHTRFNSVWAKIMYAHFQNTPLTITTNNGLHQRGGISCVLLSKHRSQLDRHKNIADATPSVFRLEQYLHREINLHLVLSICSEIKCVKLQFQICWSGRNHALQEIMNFKLWIFENKEYYCCKM